MATGGEPDPSICEDNRTEQTEEVTALEAIYGDFGCVQVINRVDDNGKDNLYTLKLDVSVRLPKESIRIEAWAPYEDDCAEGRQNTAQDIALTAKHSLQRTESGRRWHSSFEVTHLTPLCLYVTLPHTYPSDTAPLLSLSSTWLDHLQLTVLCEQLDELWEESIGIPIVYTWVDWLENNTLKKLGLESSVVVTPYTSDEADMGLRDPRAIPECTDLRSSIVAILQHDLAEENKVFRQNQQTCEICFEEKQGTEFHRLDECLHHYCHECMSAHCELHVKEGTVQHLRCPDNDCDVFIPPYILRAVLGEECYQRWERILLQKSLDSMEDIVYCPRCAAAVIRESEEDLKLARCVTCMYNFCTQCYEKWHAEEPCLSADGRLKKIEELTKSSADNREKQRKLRLLQLEYMNIKTVEETAKQCPSCKVDIVKVEGCNKVTCIKCGRSMCWICAKSIKDYNHFKQGCDLFVNEFGFVRNRVPVRQAPQRAVEIERQLGIDPEARNRVARCPRCAQRNLKENRNNHLRCWCCKSNFCYQCKTVITGLVTNHFSTAKPCKQHSD